MYIQPQEEPVMLPKGYSGSAFSDFGIAAKPPPVENEEQPALREQHLVAEEPPLQESGIAGQDSEPVGKNLNESEGEGRGESREAFCHSAGGGRGREGFFSKIPFLSSFLPPSGKKNGFLPDWAVPLILLYLLLERPENDLLPFLLILLLWD